MHIIPTSFLFLDLATLTSPLFYKLPLTFTTSSLIIHVKYINIHSCRYIYTQLCIYKTY